MSESDLESQIDELLALESIYDQTCFRTSRPTDGLTPDQLRKDELLAGFFTAEINFSSPVVVKLKSVIRKNQENNPLCDTPAQASSSQCDNNSNTLEVTSLDVEVTSLPPIVLNFEFPRDYPSSSAPNFSLTSKWMPHATLTRVAKRLDVIWEENSDHLHVDEFPQGRIGRLPVADDFARGLDARGRGRRRIGSSMRPRHRRRPSAIAGHQRTRRGRQREDLQNDSIPVQRVFRRPVWVQQHSISSLQTRLL